MEEPAYMMQRAYQKYKTRDEAIRAVHAKWPSVSWEILAAMWDGIDALVDMNEIDI